MPLKEFKCPKCGSITEKLVGTDTVTIKCGCGGDCKINYSGKCYVAKRGSGCGGNCKGCSGCKN
jgi:hypothetical protein